MLRGRLSSRRPLGVKVKGGRWREQPLPREIVAILERERSMADDEHVNDVLDSLEDSGTENAANPLI